MLQDAENKETLVNDYYRINKLKQKESRVKAGKITSVRSRTEMSTATSVGGNGEADSKLRAMEIDDGGMDAGIQDVTMQCVEKKSNFERNNFENITQKSKNGRELGRVKVGTVKESEKLNKGKDDATKKLNNGHSSGGSTKQSTNGNTASAAPPPPPVLKGTLSYNLENRKHMIRGMWNYENSNAFPPQRFELVRSLDKNEEIKKLPKDGEFHGSFSLAYFHTTSKGKQKERSKVITESGVKIKFTPDSESGPEHFKVDGEGTNQFGVFNINGTATPSDIDGDPTYDIVLRKRYKPAHLLGGSATPSETTKKSKKSKKRKSNLLGQGVSSNGVGVDSAENGPLPPPSESYPSRVVCLQGKLLRDESEDLGVPEVVHRINGMWASGLDFILADPQNARGLCNRFEYEHKSSLPNKTFPISGRYSGWFDLTKDDGSRTKISEKDITLKFRKNNAGYYNIEGKGSNAFGKYSITGTLTNDNVLTIFRHFQARKIKTKDSIATKAPNVTMGVSVPGKVTTPMPEMKVKLDDVVVPGGDKNDGQLESILPPESGTYSALMRGVMKLNDDGSHTCQGKWAINRELYDNNTVSNFSFRLEPHFAAQGAAAMKKAKGEEPEEDTTRSTGVSLSTAPPGSMTFPVDSALYKGSFQLKRGATKYTSVIDQQIALKFRKNTEGSFNVYGQGINNNFGQFNLFGKLISTGRGSSGHVELYRMYPPQTAKTQSSHSTKPEKGLQSGPILPKAQPQKKIISEKVVSTTTIPSSINSKPSLQRSSSRLVKLPSRLEDDDPKAQIGRLIDKCGQVLKIIQEKDIAIGAFFGQPVDPVAHGIPTYHQIIKEPMDLGTIQTKMESNEISSPEEFGKLVRLVFDNAMTFNVEATHVVHQAARQLLILFNQKFRDIERACENIRRQHKLPAPAEAGKGKATGKGKNKRKMNHVENKSTKKMRLEEAQVMAAANAKAMANLVAAAPSGVSLGDGVTRTEFNLMLRLLDQLQDQVVQTYTLLANMSSDSNEISGAIAPASASAADILPYVPPAVQMTQPKPQQKKPMPKPRKEEKLLPTKNEDKELTFEEQQQLTDTINALPPDKLPGVIDIIRESGIGDDEEEIDLEIDVLDTVTQRKLQRYVAKHVKMPRQRKQKAATKAKPKAAPKAKPAQAIPKKPQPVVEVKPAVQDSFFNPGFGFEDDDDTDSDSSGEIKSPKNPQKGKDMLEDQDENNEDEEDDEDDDNDDDDDDDDDSKDDNAGFGGSWNVSKPSAPSTGAEDDEWAKGKTLVEVSKARDADRKAREEKYLADEEEKKRQRLADAAARVEEVRAKRDREAADEARLREEKEKEAEEKRQADKAALKRELESQKQDVDLGDAQRAMMQDFENNYFDEGDGASPSSDFGF